MGAEERIIRLAVANSIWIALIVLVITFGIAMVSLSLPEQNPSAKNPTSQSPGNMVYGNNGQPAPPPIPRNCNDSMNRSESIACLKPDLAS